LLLRRPEALENPFYLSFPDWALYPMIALATAATVIASQATISGAFSLTRQAIQLGYLPRMSVLHTSERTMGQVFVPAVNWILLVAVLAAVVGFGSSARLSSAYGIAVMGTMLVTTMLTFFVLRFQFRYPLWLCAAATACFLLVDLVFFAAAAHKVLDGGWFPLAIAAVVFAAMLAWRRGREQLRERLLAGSPPLAGFLATLLAHPPQRIAGTAVFLTSSPQVTPNALLHSLKHYRVLHERNVFLTVLFVDAPWVPDAERVEGEPIAADCWRVTARYGFMEEPDVREAIELWCSDGQHLEPLEASYFLSREKIVAGVNERGVRRIADRMFAAMARNASSVSDFFNIPANRVVELGTRVEM